MATRKSNPSRKATATRSTSQTFPRRSGKTIRAAIDNFLLDRESRNFSGIEMLFKRLRARAKLTDKRISAHIFRHTFAVRYLMLGGDIFSLQELLGHEDISIIKNYMHLNDVNVQAQKRKFSPRDYVPFAIAPGGRRQRSDFREPVKRKGGRGKKSTVE